MAITIVVSCYKSVKVYPLDQRVPSNTYCTAVENLPTTPPLSLCPSAHIKKLLPRPLHLALHPQLPQHNLSPLQPQRYGVFRHTFRSQKTLARYALWLQTFYSKQNVIQGQGIMVAFLRHPTPPAQRRARNYPQSACVSSAVKALEEKVEGKKKKQEEKQEKEDS